MSKTQFLYVEDGSVNTEDLEQKIKEKGLDIIIVVYRQNSNPPQLVDVNKENK